MGSGTADEQPSPEDYLSLALGAESPQTRLRLANAGLEATGEETIDDDTRWLLLRQRYLAYLELGELAQAAEVALAMTGAGTLADVAHHDAARALWALGDRQRAIAAQRLAARCAPAERRSFQRWTLGALQHWSGDPNGALTTLEKALRWSQKDRALIRAHQAFIRLTCGEPVDELDGILEELEASPHGRGYGLFLLGMIHHHLGNAAEAQRHLQAFANRHASADSLLRMTLSEELARARAILEQREQRR